MSFDLQPLGTEDEAADTGGAEERRARARRRGLRRLDVALGVLVGVIWIVVAPGIAIAGIIAVLVLALAGISFLVSRRRRRAASRLPRRRRRRRAAV
jgi:hypothetical protein